MADVDRGSLKITMHRLDLTSGRLSGLNRIQSLSLRRVPRPHCKASDTSDFIEWRKLDHMHCIEIGRDVAWGRNSSSFSSK